MIIVPVLGSIQRNRSSTLRTPWTFSAPTLMATRSRSSKIQPSKQTTPSLTLTSIKIVEPNLRRELHDDAPADFRIAGRLLLIGRGQESRETADDVGTRDEPDKLAASHDGKSLDGPALHQRDKLVKGRRVLDRRRISGHDLANDAAIGMRVVEGLSPR